MARAQRIANLDCRGDAQIAAVEILRTRFDEMCRLRDYALEWSDIEGVHDMRVASRRLRSALGDFETLFGTNEFVRLGRRIKNLARKLGAVRDEDVAIVALEDFAAHADARVKRGIKMFIEEHAKRREAAREILVEAVSDENLARLRARFDRFAAPYALTERESGEGQITVASDSFAETGSEVLKHRWRKLSKQIEVSIYQPLSSEPLHEARIEAKRMRYALELFDSCWNGKLKFFAKEIADLQTSLGEIHDLDAWVQSAGGRLTKHVKHESRSSQTSSLNESSANDSRNSTAAKQARASSSVTNDETIYRAAVWLLDYCTEQRAKSYSKALARWQKWQTTNFAARLAAALDEN